MGTDTSPPALEIGQPDASRRLVTLQHGDGGARQLLEADMVLWTAGTKPAGSGDRKLKVILCQTGWSVFERQQQRDKQELHGAALKEGTSLGST